MAGDLPCRIKYLLTEAKHDCFFVVGPENGPKERIGAIKPLLMADSEPFRAMLQDSELAETGDIHVTDVEPETFWNFLKCVYGASSIVIPKLTFEKCAKLLYVIEKYLVNDIKICLTDHMKNMISSENIFVALSHPICYQTAILENEILEILKYDFGKIVKDDKFLKLSKTAIQWILKVQYLIVKEIEIWNAVLRWAKHKTGSNDGRVLRSCISGFLKYIRFLTMDYNEFWDSVVSSKILLEGEINDICRAFVSGMSCTTKHLCKIRRDRYDTESISKYIICEFMEFPRSAFIRCTVISVSDLTSSEDSKTYHWAGHLWHLEVVKKEDKAGKDCLGVYVGCSGKAYNWKCHVDVEISLINQIGKPDKTRKFTKTLCPSTPSWGFFLFCEWNALLTIGNGFIKDNSIILVAEIQLKNP